MNHHCRRDDRRCCCHQIRTPVGGCAPPSARARHSYLHVCRCTFVYLSIHHPPQRNSLHHHDDERVVSSHAPATPAENRRGLSLPRRSGTCVWLFVCLFVCWGKWNATKTHVHHNHHNAAHSVHSLTHPFRLLSTVRSTLGSSRVLYSGRLWPRKVQATAAPSSLLERLHRLLSTQNVLPRNIVNLLRRLVQRLALVVPVRNFR